MESFTHLINMAAYNPQIFNEKIKELGIKIPTLARLLNLAKENLYKWSKGHRPANYEDNIKLENFTKGLFDQFIIDGKIGKDYEYDKAIAIIFPKNPTNDLFENWNKNIALCLKEVAVPFGRDYIALNKIILMQDEQINKLKIELENCLNQNSKANFSQKSA